MHSDPKREKFWNFDYINSMTAGGVGVHEDIQNPQIKKELCEGLTPIGQHIGMQLHNGREGYYGWLGLGGSVAQWHPELKIGFGFVPNDLNFVDFNCTRGSRMQRAVKECLAGTYSERKMEDSSCCTVF